MRVWVLVRRGAARLRRRSEACLNVGLQVTMNVYHPVARRRRARAALGVLALAVFLLLAAFMRVQVLSGSRWTLQARANYLRQVVLPAPRGTIYDRNGLVLADNVPGYRVTVLPGPPDSVRSTLTRMARYLDLSSTETRRLVGELSRFGREVVVDDDADFRAVSALEERTAEFPDVAIEMRPRRRYPAGRAAAHVLGHVGRITQDEVRSHAFPEDRYGPNAVVGKMGVEEQYEARLQGREGMRYVEVNARGRIVGDFTSGPAIPARPGEELRLSLDLELQRWIDHIFPDSLAGAVVALDPTDGGVLALYSAPTYDPNAFVGGIASAEWDSLSADAGRPLYNRAIQGLYAPASTWKPATAAIALDLGVVTPEETMPEPCRGTFLWGGRVWHCWRKEGHGFNDLAEAIGNSCDVYFYQLGLRVGLDRLLARAVDFGFSDLTGIDLPNERRGVFPANRDFWTERYGYRGQEGEVLSLAIGQGPNAQTPLRMAQFYEALARGGSAPPPAVAQDVDLGPGWRLDLRPGDIEALRQGLRNVTAPGGTAHLQATLERWEVIGKTGTGQNAASLAGRGDNDAWFAGMAGPFGEEPEIVVVALVEQGGSGSAVAAPLVAKTADFYLRRKHGIPLDTVQTLAEWVRVRGWPSWYRERFGGNS